MLKKAVFIGMIGLFFASCNNKLQILAPYKESVSVFGLLNQDDSVQFIRVERVFLGEGNALVMAQNQDSVYFHPGDAKVSLHRYKNGVRVSVDNPASTAMEIVCTETMVPLQSGTFNTNQLLYRTNHPIYDDSQYDLVVHINKSGKDFTVKSPVGLIGDFKNGLGIQGSILTANLTWQPIPSVNIVPSIGAPVKCLYGSPANSSVCSLVLRFFYTEYYSGFPPTSKYIDFNMGYRYTTQTYGGEQIDLSYVGDGLLEGIATGIPVDPAIDHRTADSVYFILSAGGRDLSLYNQVNNTTSLSQDKPNYTNLVNAVGIFSSRRDYKLLKYLHVQTCQDRLATSKQTCPLKFYGYGGTLLVCP